MSISQLVLVSRETRTVLTASFLKTPKLRKWSMDQGNLMSEIVRAHRLGLFLMTRDWWLSQSVARKSVITNSKQLEPKKNAEFYKKNYGVSKKIFVMFINKVLLRWRNYENSRVPTFDTLARRKLIEDQNTIMELSGRLQELQNEVNCMNDFKDFQDAESVRSGNSHVTSRPVSFPPHPILEGMLRHSFVSPRRKEGPPSIWDTWYIGKRFCKSTRIFISSLSSRIESMGYNNWGAASYVYSGEKWKARTKSRSEMPVWTVSQRFSHLQWRRLLKELWCRPTTTADFGSPFWQVSLHQQPTLAGR